MLCFLESLFFVVFFCLSDVLTFKSLLKSEKPAQIAMLIRLVDQTGVDRF